LIEGGNVNKEKGMDRRKFLKNSSAGIIGAGVFGQTKWLSSQEDSGSEVQKIKEYRTLGRTGFRVSDVSSGSPSDVGLLNTLLDAGVNYIDTSEGYGEGKSERRIAEALEGRKRDSIFIATKLQLLSVLRPIPEEDLTKSGILKRAYNSLERLKTDYVDCLMISNAETVEALKSEEFHAATEQLKKEGKIRFVGVTHHGTQWFYRKPEETMETVLMAAVDDGRFDVMLLAYNFLKQDQSEKVLEACHKNNIGTALMKTNPIRYYYIWQHRMDELKKQGKEIDERTKGWMKEVEKKYDAAQDFLKAHNLANPYEVELAAIKFVLSNAHVSTVCLSYRSYEHVKRILDLSGTRLDQGDRQALSAYSRAFGDLYCRHACGLCERACPHAVPINTIMRYDHYFAAQGREKYAIQKYESLNTSNADRCATCPGYCQSHCPYGLPIPGLLVAAHQSLSLA
jgi:aryl-alcohol dehydrogenase-like predicted oxidoreductase